MNTAAAGSLATYINNYSTDFFAETLDNAGEVWVLIRDNEPHLRTRYIEPILDVPAYLAREDRPQPLLLEFRTLLHNWLSDYRD